MHMIKYIFKWKKNRFFCGLKSTNIAFKFLKIKVSSWKFLLMTLKPTKVAMLKAFIKKANLSRTVIYPDLGHERSNTTVLCVETNSDWSSETTCL